MSIIDDIVNQTISNMPEPSPNVSEIGVEENSNDTVNENTNETTTENTNPNGFGIRRDKKGNLFNPELHATNDNGEPTYNNDGSFRKKRGRKKGSVNGTPQGGQNNQAELQKCLAAGRATAQTIITLGIAIGGEEWQPIIDPQKGINEPQMLADAWAEYYQAAGVVDMPPWMGVIIATGMYASPRMFMPKTKGRIQRVKEWVVKTYVSYRMRKGK